jgi:hypothetical protein
LPPNHGAGNIDAGVHMSHQLQGVIAGLVFGALSVGLMWRLTFADRTAALAAAVIERFAIGFVIGCVQLAWPGWLIGLCFGLLLSLPSAIITKAHVPILVMGSIGGIVIGGIIHGWA